VEGRMSNIYERNEQIRELAEELAVNRHGLRLDKLPQIVQKGLYELAVDEYQEIQFNLA
jgi:hypothetical protein